MFASPSQVACTIFGVHIYYYGIIMAMAIAIGVLVADWIGTKFSELKTETIIDMSPYVIILGLLGARFYYCLLDYNFYWRFPTEILAIRHGGISIHGAIIGGIIGLLLFSYRHKISAKKLCDVSAIGLSLGQAIGRWGNFFNSEAYGGPTNLPWKLYIAPQYRVIPYQDVSFYHPAFLYESILDLIIFAVLFYVIKTKIYKKDGNIALFYLFFYSLARILVEICRIDSVRYVFGVPVAIVMSVSIIIVSVILLLINNRHVKENK